MTTLGQKNTHWVEVSNLPFIENRPTMETAQVLRDELLFQRATQTYLCALILMNMLGNSSVAHISGQRTIRVG